MEKDPEVVRTGQGTPENPHQGDTVAHINPEGVPIHTVQFGGQGDPDTSETGEDIGQTPGRVGDHSDSAGTIHGVVGRSIGFESRTYEGLDKGGDMGKGLRPKTV